MALVSLFFGRSHEFHTPDGSHDVETSHVWPMSTHLYSHDELCSLKFTGLSFTCHRLFDTIARCGLLHYRGTRASRRVCELPLRHHSMDVMWLNDLIQHITTIIFTRTSQGRGSSKSYFSSTVVQLGLSSGEGQDEATRKDLLGNPFN